MAVFLLITNQIWKLQLLSIDHITRTFQRLLEISSFITIENPLLLRVSTYPKFYKCLISFLLDFLRPVFKEFCFNSAVEQYSFCIPTKLTHFNVTRCNIASKDIGKAETICHGVRNIDSQV